MQLCKVNTMPGAAWFVFIILAYICPGETLTCYKCISSDAYKCNRQPETPGSVECAEGKSACLSAVLRKKQEVMFVRDCGPCKEEAVWGNEYPGFDVTCDTCEDDLCNKPEAEHPRGRATSVTSALNAFCQVMALQFLHAALNM